MLANLVCASTDGHSFSGSSSDVYALSAIEEMLFYRFRRILPYKSAYTLALLYIYPPLFAGLLYILDITPLRLHLQESHHHDHLHSVAEGSIEHAAHHVVVRVHGNLLVDAIYIWQFFICRLKANKKE